MLSIFTKYNVRYHKWNSPWYNWVGEFLWNQIINKIKNEIFIFKCSKFNRKTIEGYKIRGIIGNQISVF